MPRSSDSGRGPVLCWLGLALLAALPGTLRAEARPPWYPAPYAYVVIDQDLRGALEAFGRNLGLPMSISPQVKGRAPRQLRGQTAGAFLDALCGGSGLTWFFDGNVLHVNSDEEIMIRQFEPVGYRIEDLQASLDEMALSGMHLALRGGVHGDGLVVSGPPPYMALVERRIEQLQPAETVAAPVRERGVRVFRGSAGIEVVRGAARSD